MVTSSPHFFKHYGCVEQCQLRGEFSTYASAFITTALDHVSILEVTKNPYAIWDADRLDLSGPYHCPRDINSPYWDKPV